MKQTTKMSRAVGQLEKIYFHLNEDFFDGGLPTPIITVQSKPGTMGHCSVAKVWQRKEDNAYELNIAAEVLNYPIEDTLDTMIHEMVHLFCRENGIKEVSRGGSYHNGRFKAEAEKRGLNVSNMDSTDGTPDLQKNSLSMHFQRNGMKFVSVETAVFSLSESAAAEQVTVAA